MSCETCDHCGHDITNETQYYSCGSCATVWERQARTIRRLRALADGYRSWARRCNEFALRCQWQAADIVEFVRSEERARIVAALRGYDSESIEGNDTLRMVADAIERGEL